MTASPDPAPDTNPAASQDIVARIKAHEDGIGIDAFMQAAAAAYYAGAKPFGREGDFITSPDISQMFGEMIAVWCVDVWAQAGSPAQVMLAELGPGRGTMMADILRTARNWPAFAQALDIHLVETSPQLRTAQKTALADYAPVWHDDISTLPRDRFSLIVSNEFFDALPICQWVWQNGAWHERCVKWDAAAHAPVFALRPAPVDIAAQIPAQIPAHLSPKDGDIFETSPACRRVAYELGAHIAQSGGACLAIDYGHAHSGFGDTLQTVSRHKYTPVLENIGGQDITAHVDFAALTKAAGEAGAQVWPVITQERFLTSLGITARADQLAQKANPQQRAQIPLDLHRLIAPSAMGGLFKAACWTRRSDNLRPAGFQDQEGG